MYPFKRSRSVWTPGTKSTRLKRSDVHLHSGQSKLPERHDCGVRCRKKADRTSAVPENPFGASASQTYPKAGLLAHYAYLLNASLSN